jgi:hypothetical protein
MELTPHEPTVMRPTLREWLHTDDGRFPDDVELRCQECGRTDSVTRGLAVRGNYICEGGGVVKYEVRREDRPSIAQVVQDEGGVRGEALHELLRLYDNLQTVAEQVDALRKRLEELIMTYGVIER